MVSVDKQGEAEDEAPTAVGDEPDASAAPRDSDDPADTSRTFPLDVSSPGADRLRTTVRIKLSEFIGSYTDDVLASYVVVLVGHGKQRKQAVADLEAFLGSQSEAFVSWLWEHLTENLSDYVQVSEENDKEKEPAAQESKEQGGDEKQDSTKEPEPAGEKSKRSRSPEPWSRRRRTRTETKESKETKEKEPSPPKENADPPPPRLRASRRLLEFAVRDAVAPSSTATTRRTVDSAIKRLRSVVATDQDKPSESNGKLKPRPTIAKPTRASPAMLIAVKAAAAAAEDVANRKPAANKALTRFNSSVWDRLGGKSDDELADHQSLREAENEITEKMEYVQVSSKSKAGERHLRRGGGERPRASGDPGTHSYDDDVQGDVQQQFERPAEAPPRKESKRHSVKKDRRQGKPERVSLSEKQKAVLLAERRSKPAAVLEANHVGAREKTVEAPDGKDQGVSEMKKRMRQVELEVSKLRTRQVEATKPAAAPAVAASVTSQAPAQTAAAQPAQASSQDSDSRTITVSNVLLSTPKEAISAHFASCGEVVKTTILTDAAGKPKGSAHVEFASKDAADKALTMNDSNLHSRALKVTRKDASVVAVAESSGGGAAPTPRPAAAVMMRPVRMPMRGFPRAAFMRGSPYSLRPPPPRLMRPSFPVSAPHLQWKRDGATSSPGGALVKNGFRSNVGPIRKRSLSYVRPVVPSIPEATALPASADEQKAG